tara:strand:- start:1182 stop:1412 length:231 start_codon:yes stop_codon:yes gene_type:complete
MSDLVTTGEIKDKLLKLYSQNLIDDKTANEILVKLKQEKNYDRVFFQELLKRFKERLDVKLDRSMVNYLKQSLKKS